MTEFMYGIPTGYVNPFMKRSRMAVRLISELEGFKGVHPDHVRHVTIWLFDTHTNAVRARNFMRMNGIECGKNISRFLLADDGVLEFDSEWAKKHGMGT